MEYDEESHLLKCDSCESVMKPEEYDYALMVYDKGKPISGDITGFTCPNCGSEILVGGVDVNVTCPFCNSSMVVFGLRENELEPEKIIPFKLDEESAVGKLLTWWSSKESMPKLDKDKLKMTMTDAYIPVWLYNGSVSVDMQAKVAPYEASASQVTADSVVYTVEKRISSSFNKIPVVASAKTNSVIFHGIEPYNYGQLVDFNPAYLSGHVAERYYISPDDAIHRYLQQVQKYGIEQCKSSIETDKLGGAIIRSHTTGLESISKEVIYSLLPVWICSYRYNGKNHQVFINGQTGKVYGELLVTKSKYSLELSAFAASSLFCFISIALNVWEMFFNGGKYSTSTIMYGLLVFSPFIISFLQMFLFNKGKMERYTTKDGDVINLNANIEINQDIQYKQGAKFNVFNKIIVRVLVGILGVLFWGKILVPAYAGVGYGSVADFMVIIVGAMLAAVDSFFYSKKRLAYYQRHDKVDYFEYIKAGTVYEEPAKVI